MPSKLFSVELHGLEGILVEIEVDKLGGIPAFIIVGLPDAAVKEASERVRSAIKNSGFLYPRSKIIVNLAPADIRKMGPRYDLPIALGILAMEDLIDARNFSNTAITGELALNGNVRPINGILSSVDLARKAGFRRMIVPAENAKEASLIKGIEILPAGTLKEAALHIEEKLCVLPIAAPADAQNQRFDVDMASIRGQGQAKRALEIAAAGSHNVLMCGPPGAGKTLLARALAGILPSMDEQETLEVTKIFSICGLLPKKQPLIAERPFRSIHHTASAVSIVGGGDMPRPGEISLAHRGILFMDEIAEFPPHVLDVLRQPMENKYITVSRAKGSFTYPTEFTLVAAMNPCPCGYFNSGRNGKRCKCTSRQIKLYQKRLSGPLLDRIDIHLNVQQVEHNELANSPEGQTSEEIRKRVQYAAIVQRERFAHEAIRKNSEMTNGHIEKFCPLDPGSKSILNSAMQRMDLSARAYFRIIKLARTAADLEGSANIKSCHISESIHFRNKVF